MPGGKPQPAGHATAAGRAARRGTDAGGRDTAASAAQYLLLGGFAAVASGISSQGLTGFARSNMGLAWAVALPAVLRARRRGWRVRGAARAPRRPGGGEALAPRLAVWGLVAASAAFNCHPRARAARTRPRRTR